MKRILSVLLCIGLLFGACSLGTVAETEVVEAAIFELFENEVTYLSFFTEHVAEGEVYPASAVVAYVTSSYDFTEYGVGEPVYEDEDGVYYDVYTVPAEVFEATVGRSFELSDELVAALRAYMIWGMDGEQPFYDEETDSYTFYGGGGLGDSAGYYTHSYVKTGNRYEAYFYYVERGFDWTPDMVLGQDYIFEETYDGGVQPCQILRYAKFVLEYDGEDVKFLGSQDLDSIPEISGATVRPAVDGVFEGDFLYRVVDGKELWLCYYYGEHEGEDMVEITVPATVNGLPVTNVLGYAFGNVAGMPYSFKVNLPDTLLLIGEDAFSYCDNLTEVNIPDSVEYISAYAFSGSGIKEITIPAATNFVAMGAFYGCADLTAIHVAEGNGMYTSEDGVLFNKAMTVLHSYPAGKTDTDYVIPDGVEMIWYGAFRDAFALKQITLPDSVREIEEVAFAYSGITSINIPEGVTDIPYCAFDSCSELAEVTFPSTLKTIDTWAFCGTALTSVILPEGVTYISEGAFDYCNSLEEVVLPSTVQYIGYWAFPNYEDAALKEVVFLGSEEEWELVEKDADWSGYDGEVLPVVFATPLVDETSGVKVFDSHGATFADEITLAVKPVTDAEVLAKLATYENASVLDITLLKNGEETQPEAPVTVRVPVPQGMNGENCTIVRVEDDGTLTDMKAVLSGDMLVFTTEHFSHYAVVETASAALGDVNGDGAVNTTDARLVLQYAVGKISEGDLDLSVADVNRDNTVNTTDARLILQFAVGKIENFD